MRIRWRLLLGLLSLVLVNVTVAGLIVRQHTSVRTWCEFLGRVTDQERLILECRLQETRALLDDEGGDLLWVQSTLDTLLAATEEVMQLVPGSSIREPLIRLREMELSYSATLKVLMARGSLDISEVEDSALVFLTNQRAEECLDLMASIRGTALERLERTIVTSRWVNLIAVLIGLLLSVIIAALLTRTIVTPIQELSRLAVEATKGDIQDMHVRFADLDLEKFDAPETHELATSLQRLVEALRERVSSERGLMDAFHLTVAALLHRAVGPDAWGLIERARARAGFGAFTDISPEDAEVFIAALQEEIDDQLPPDSWEMLAEAIRDAGR